MFKIHVCTYFKQGIWADQIHLNISKSLATIRLQVYTFGVESFTDGRIREQCNLTSRFPNVFVQGLNLAKIRPTSLIWTEYTLIAGGKMAIFLYCQTPVQKVNEVRIVAVKRTKLFKL